MQKKAVLLINIGTPDKPEKKQVRKYLSEFLNDGRVIDIPWLARKILVNLIIIPFRTSKSTKLYKTLWTEKGSPLLVYSKQLEEKLNKRSGDEYDYYTAMRYGNPSLNDVLDHIKDKNYDEIILVPMFPQYASSTTGSLLEFAFKKTSDWYVIPAIRSINQFYDHPAFINSFVEQINREDPESYDHIIFSYHGLPNSQVEKTHPGISSVNCSCENAMPAHGKYCYKATCYETTRKLADALNLNPGNYTVSFQSRLSKKWLTPFTDEVVTGLAKQGKKKILIAAPAFVTDCLETIVELDVEYKELFLENGGDKLTMVKSLNDEDHWVKSLAAIINGD